MKNYAVVLLIAPSLFFSLPHTGFAAPVETDSRPVTLGLWMGYSPSSITFLSKMRDTRLLLAGLEVTHSHFNILNTPIGLSAQLILFGQTDFPENGSFGPRDQRKGFGLIPIKASVPLLNPSGSHPYLFGGAGLLLFTRKFPNHEGTRLNAVIEAGAGYQIHLSDQLSLNIDYRFHHLSNGQTGQENPGIDSNLFSATLTIKM